MKNFYTNIKFTLLFPFTLILLIIRIFYKYKISKIETNIFGFMTTPIELFVCERKNNSIEFNLIWFRDKKISNLYIYQKWKKKLFILPRHLLEPIYVVLSKYNFFNFIINILPERNGEKIHWIKNNRIDFKNLLQKYPPSITFEKNEKNEAELYLKENKIYNNKFITFCSRSKYGREIVGKIEKYETARNSNINKYLLGLTYLSKKNYKLIRTGKNEKDPLCTDDVNIIDFATSKYRNDFLETYLVSKCEFMICSNYGGNELAVLFRKKRLMIDYFDFPSLGHQNLFYAPMILPKVFFRLKDNSLVSFKDACDKKLYYIHKIHDLNDLGYGLQDNSEEDIYFAVKNFYLLLNNKIDCLTLYSKQEKFWNMIEKYFHFKNVHKSIICPSFFNKNQNYFI